MRRKGPLAALALAVVALVGGCGSPGPSIPVHPARPTWAPGSTALAFDAAPRYSCGTFPFEPSLLDRIGHAETDTGPLSDALRAHLATAGPDYDMLPDTGWLLVGSDDRRAEFLATGPGAILGQVSLEHGATGWKVSGWGSGCRPFLDLPDGLGPAEWVVNPKHPAPEATSRTVHVLVTERSCASAASSVGRVVGPAIRFEDDRVLVAFGVIPQVGDAFTCPSNPPTPLEIDLGQPLGNRVLVDASTIPYVEVGTADPLGWRLPE